MLTEAFERRFFELLSAARIYHDSPRDPEHVLRLAAARRRLDVARRNVAEERARLTSRGARARPRRRTDDSEWARAHVRSFGLTSN